jgi:hypothetical protein
MSIIPDKEHIERLKKSTEISYLQPVIVDQNGKVLVGRHRKWADPNWPEVRVEVKDNLHGLLIRLAGNIQRNVSVEETSSLLIAIAKELELRGVAKETICATMAKLPGMPYSERWIRECLPIEYKMESKRREFAEALPRIERQAHEEQVQEEATLASLEHKAPAKVETMLIYPDCLCKKCPHQKECY